MQELNRRKKTLTIFNWVNKYLLVVKIKKQLKRWQIVLRKLICKKLLWIIVKFNSGTTFGRSWTEHLPSTDTLCGYLV